MSAALMIQGTGSDVGKSLIVAGLARAYTARGLLSVPSPRGEKGRVSGLL